jgi:cytidyltransferase-like protein
MSKIQSLTQAIKWIKRLRREGKKVALVTGCFDVVHAGHVELLRYAKTKADFVVVGVESDETVRRSKGSQRPIFAAVQRCIVVSEMQSVDAVFVINLEVKFGSQEAKYVYKDMTAKLNPDYLVVTPQTDKFWREKEKQVKLLHIKLLKFRRKTNISSSDLILRMS